MLYIIKRWMVRYGINVSTDNILVLFGCFYRIAILLLIRTTFVPDEYYQYVEPSHLIAFGKGVKTWEWEPEHRIRSFVPLLPLIGAYKSLQMMGLDFNWCLHLAPRLLFTLLALYADFHYLHLSKYVLDIHAPPPPVPVLHDHNTRSHDHPTAAAHTLEHKQHHSESFSAAQCVYIMHLLSWSLSYCLPRTLGNSLESCLLIIGTSLLLIPPTHDDYKAHIWSISALARKQRQSELHLSEYSRLALAVFVISISVYSRPTAALLWLPLVCLKLWSMDSPLTFILKTAVPVGLLVLQVSVLVDTHLYGNVLTVSPLQFYVANVSKGYAAYFGVQPWHWNFSQGLPVLLGIYTPLVLYGLFKSPALSNKIRGLCGISTAYAVGLSLFSAHQEIRFLLPCLPFLHMAGGGVLHDILAWCCSDSHRKIHRLKKSLALLGVIVLFLAQCCGLVFLLRYHQCGTEEALALVGADIRTQASSVLNKDTAGAQFQSELEEVPEVNIFIAAPCYSFPGHAGLHLIPGGSASVETPHWFGGSSSSSDAVPMALPDVNIHSSPCYLNLDVADHFDVSPERHLATLLHANDTAATAGGKRAAATYAVDYVLTFDSYYDSLEETLRKSHFEQIARIKHAYFRYDFDDPHFKQHVLVFRRKKISVKVSYDVPSLPPTTAPPSPVPVSPPSPPPPPQGADKSRPESGESHKENGGERNSRESEHSTPHGGDEHKTGSPHGNSAEKEPYFAPTPLKAAERKHAPFRAFVAAGGTLAAARGSNLMDDIELADLLN